jgi:predicted RNase H-like HicB family nuclease
MVPALPGCHSLGDSREAALTNVQDAIRLYVEDLEANGEPVPEESPPLEFVTVETDALRAPADRSRDP